jgi:hypothetical protein
MLSTPRGLLAKTVNVYVPPEASSIDAETL